MKNNLLPNLETKEVCKHFRYHSSILILVLCAFCVPSFLLSCSAPDSKADPEQGLKETVKTTTEDSEVADSNQKAGIRYDSSAFLNDIPEWNGFAFTYINDNQPQFKENEIWETVQESLCPLDDLGRCGAATSCIGQEGMPTEPRGDISSIEPTGWHTDRYDFVEGEALYNRCHLIGHQLSGDDAIPRNLITGTSYMNRDGMLPFENAIAAYVKGTGNHVMYRVDPIFSGNDMVCRGVHMEAVSVEDNGAGLAFNVFCYDVQPGVDIDYATGDNKASEDSSILEEYQEGKFSIIADTHGVVPGVDDEYINQSDKNRDNKESEERLYVLNTNTGRFHYPNCKSVKDIADHNKQEEETTRESLINRGYKPCGNCKP